jgi:Lrp/AsnC family transcriptional regulator for asnA, asnC and gidA
MYQIDKIDLRIVDLLMKDGRMSSAKISRYMGDISERAVRYRIQRMTKEGLIKISAIPDPKSIGFKVIADIFIEVETGQISSVAEQLLIYKQVSYVACSIGEKDISAQVVARSTDEVYMFVTDVIGKIPGVRKTTTSIVPIILRDVYEWRIPDSILEEQ